jgi:hypothetical protein
MRPRVFRLSAGIALSFLLMVLPASATGTSGPYRIHVSADGRTHLVVGDLPPAEVVDLKLVAASQGITLEQAIDRYGWQDQFRHVTERVRSAFPHDIAGMAMTGDGRGARLSFKGEIPPDAVALVRALPVGVDLVGGAGFSEEELQMAQCKAVRAVADRLRIGDVGAGYDAETGVVTIHYKSSKTAEARPESVAAVARSTLPPNSRIRIEVQARSIY